MITGKIDVTKIDKSRLYKGEKGKYLSFVLIETPNNTFGNDYMIIESISKAEKEAGIKGRILGNAKILLKREPEASPEAESMADSDADEGDGLPF
jgi:hypothetical protein